MSIDKDFKDYFSEFEAHYVNLREKVNSFKISDNGLDEKLLQEYNRYYPYRSKISDRLGEIVFNFNKKQSKIHKEFVRSSYYYKIIQEAPFFWRIINKPNGYAGDAEMMNYIYRNQFEGETPFGRFSHFEAVRTEAAQSVRNRKDFLLNQILNLDKGKILSLGAGPSKEISEAIENHGRSDFQFTALDHDIETILKNNNLIDVSCFKAAVANALQIIKGKYRIAFPRRLLGSYCNPHKDFKGLRKLICPVKYRLDKLIKEEFDLVYAAGLYDYILTFPSDDSKGTVALTNRLFHLVKPGGTLIIGNFTLNLPLYIRYFMDYIFDWKLIYRDKQEILDFAKTISEKEIRDIQVLEEPLGINCFLKINKN